MPSSPRRTLATDSRGFLVMLALMMGMAAVSIDLLLPAFPEMRETYGLPVGSTEMSRIITTFFFGLAVGQLVYGPLSDRFGRKPMLYAGLVVFVVGAVLSVTAGSLGALVAWRFVWGFGAAAPRSLAVAVVRDSFEGDRMVRAMSLVMAIFIVVPVVAPTIGSLVLVVADWRVVLCVPIAVAAALALLLPRLPETLAPESRRGLTRASLGEALRTVVTTRDTVAYGLAATCLFGMMASFIGTAEAMIDQTFHQADAFPLIFGFIAGTLAVGSLLSARLVGRLGSARLLQVLSLSLVACAGLHAAVVLVAGGRPPLWAWLLTMSLLMPMLTMLLPNVNTSAMAPLGRVAGMGAALIGAVTTAGGAVLGGIVDATFDGTARPYAICLLVFAVLTAVLTLVVARPPRTTTDIPAVALAEI